jgi:hypothetical protein
MKTLITSFTTLAIALTTAATADAQGYGSYGGQQDELVIGNYGAGNYGAGNYDTGGYGNSGYQQLQVPQQYGYPTGIQGSPQFGGGYNVPTWGGYGQPDWSGDGQVRSLRLDIGYIGNGGCHQPQRVWHDTSHIDNIPGRWERRGCHTVWIPGRQIWHQDGHFDQHDIHQH